MNIVMTAVVLVSLIFNFFKVSAIDVKNYIDSRETVTNIYESVLDRKPTFTEKMRPTDTKALVCELLRSEEFHNMNMTEKDIINKYYNIFRGIDATAEEIEEWSTQISTSDTTLLLFDLVNSGYFNKKYNLTEDYFNKEDFIDCTNEKDNDFSCEYTEAGTYKFYVTFADDPTYYHEVKNAI